MPNYYNPYQYQQTYNQPATQQIQNGGFVSVRNEMEAMNYPIAPGNSITFKDETAPYVYTKTMGFSQLDRPIFEKYRLVKEDATETQNAPHTKVVNNAVDTSAINEIKAEIEAIWSEINALKESKSQPKKRRESNGHKPTNDNVSADQE